jgi:hypothetical protein
MSICCSNKMYLVGRRPVAFQTAGQRAALESMPDSSVVDHL